MKLRPYQEEAKAAILREWRQGNDRTLLVLPTGCGKTIVFAKLIEDCVRFGDRVLILAHTGELLEQAAAKLAAATGLGCAVEKAESSCRDALFRVVVGSVQSLMRPARLEQFPRDYFHKIIVDEAHHVLADSYQRVLAHFDEAQVLGVTATPDRSDMRNLGAYFQSLAYEYTLPRAVQEGYLSPIKAMTIPLPIDISGVQQQSGDFQAAALGPALDPYLEQIADEMWQHCQGRRTVVFLPLIATSQKMRSFLKRRGFRAVEVNGNSQERARILRDFDEGRYDVLCNAMLLTEGWDCPTVDCVVPLRATKVRALYAQMVGRGTRLAPGKDHLLLLDFLWNTTRLDLCRPAALVADIQEVAVRMTENVNAAGLPVDIIEAEAQAASACVAEREEALARKLEKMRNRKRKLVDPLQFETSIGAGDLSGYVPAFGWEFAPPSDAQRERLALAGISPDGVHCSGKAEAILERVDQRREAGLTTPKQIRFLEGRGFRHVGTWQFEAANTLISRISANGWRVPPGITPETYRPRQQEKVAL